MKKILLLASIVALFASCSSKPKLELEVNISNNDSFKDKMFIVSQKIEGKVVYSDTIKIKKDNFLLKIPYEGPGLLNISIPEAKIRNVMLASEKGKINLDFDGVKSYISGTPLNDRLQAYYLESDSVSLLFSNLESELALIKDTKQFTSKMEEEFAQRRKKLLIENTDRIVAFIKENIDNPIGEYYFSIYYITFIPERKMELNSFASEKLKKEFRIQ